MLNVQQLYTDASLAGVAVVLCNHTIAVESETELSCGYLQTQECESLMRVVRELTENRSKLVCARTNLAEKLAEMQHEYMRLMRVADLSRIVSKENVAKTAKVMKTVKQVRGGDGTRMHRLALQIGLVGPRCCSTSEIPGPGY